MKKIISFALALLTVLTLASCQLSTILPPADTTGTTGGDITSSPSGDTTAESTEIPEVPTYDFIGTDLTQFVTLCEYKGIKLTDYRIEVTDTIVDRYIGELLVAEEQYTKRKTGTLNEYEIVNMDYVGKLNGEAFSGGTAMNVNFLVTGDDSHVYGIANNSDFVLGYKYIPGFASAMIGADISAPFDINVKFPDDYDNKDLAGKDVVFTITVNYVCTPAELNETTLKTISATEKVEDFKTEIKTSLAEMYESLARQKMDVNLWEYLVDTCEFKALPDEYVDAFFDSEFAYIEYIAKIQGAEVNDVLASYGYSSKEDFKEKYIIYSVKQSIIYYQILKVENLDLTDDEYKEKLDELAKANGTTGDLLESQYTKDYILDVFRFEEVNEFVFNACEFVKPE